MNIIQSSNVVCALGVAPKRLKKETRSEEELRQYSPIKTS